VSSAAATSTSPFFSPRGRSALALLAAWGQPAIAIAERLDRRDDVRVETASLDQGAIDHIGQFQPWERLSLQLSLDEEILQKALQSSLIAVGKSVLRGYEVYGVANWDGDGAEPITQDTREIASKLLEGLVSQLGAPDAAPGADGSIGLEWWKGPARLFIDVGPQRQIRTYLNLGNIKPEEEVFQWGDATLKTHFSSLVDQLSPRVADTGGTSMLYFAHLPSANSAFSKANLRRPVTFGSASSLTAATLRAGDFIIAH
jgi:hypothetical protein